MRRERLQFLAAVGAQAPTDEAIALARLPIHERGQRLALGQGAAIDHALDLDVDVRRQRHHTMANAIQGEKATVVVPESRFLAQPECGLVDIGSDEADVIEMNHERTKMRFLDRRDTPLVFDAQEILTF